MTHIAKSDRSGTILPVVNVSVWLTALMFRDLQCPSPVLLIVRPLHYGGLIPGNFIGGMFASASENSAMARVEAVSVH